ncbi:MAG: AGE family epimerase/isomerase, partial [Armatimonadota bacterium]
TWLQWRAVYMFCELYHRLARNGEWLCVAERGLQFLLEHARDEQGRYYFALARDGKPTMAPYSVFSECFAVMGCAAYYKATGDDIAKSEAIRAFEGYLQRENCPKGEWTKEMYGRAPGRNLGFYMMKANLYMVVQECLGDVAFEPELLNTMRTVLDDFWNVKYKILFENILSDGSFDLDSMGGRHLNPGHAIEAMWFIMNAASRIGNKEIVEKAADIVLAELEFAWDKEYGGIYYFMDVLGKPHVELQWNMKLWWVHNEALIATAMAYKLTGRCVFAEWFERIHEWAWTRFPDPEYGEWFGYLDRYGNAANNMKGGKWKGFFHLPRMLLVCKELFEVDPKTQMDSGR